MKNYLIIILWLATYCVYGQEAEKELKSKITDVTVFLSSAQINRTGSLQVPKGKSDVVLKALSPYIDDKSIQVSAKGNFIILAVNYKLNYLQEPAKNKQISDLILKIAVIDDSISFNKARSETNKETLDLLNKNKKLGNETSGTDINQLKLAVRYYEQEITAIKTNDILLVKKIKDLEDEKTKLNNQLNELNNQQNQPTGEITIQVQSDDPSEAVFNLSYLTGNANWIPSYDIRATDISSPIEIKYYATVTQVTGEDWENVNLTFSNANPNQSGTAPEIAPWYLDFIQIQTGYYNKGADLRSESAKPAAAVMDVEKGAALEQSARSAGVSVQENQTSVNFNVNIPYSLRSNTDNLKIELVKYSVPAMYQYFAIPKLDKDAFLIASFTGWDQYNLLQGEANLYFENTFVGRTVVDPAIQSDTMKISLGRDKSVVIARKKVDTFTQRKLVATNKVDTRGFSISARNNKSKPVNLIIEDQIPVSTRSEITVNPLEWSGADLDKITGKLTWTLQLNPQDQKELKFQYEVRYPKNQRIILE